jgi:hypothetical protein
MSSSGGTDTTTGSSRQQRHHHPTPRAETPEPLEPHRRLDPRHAPLPLLAALPAFLRVASTVHPTRLTHLIPPYPICLTPIPLPQPRLRPLQLPAWAGPSRFTWQVEEGGPARSGGPPSSKSPGGKPRKHPKAGRRPVARRGETHRAKQMEGNTRRETGVPSASVSLIPRRRLAAARPLHQRWGRRSRRGGRPGARSAQ